jgi:hypothetical protein
MFKKIIKGLIPPIFIVLYKKNFEKKPSPDLLFDGDDKLFKRVIKNAKTYGEYGCGASTKWVLNNTNSKVIAVDTSKEWVEEVLSDNESNNHRLNIKYINLGELGRFGMPIDYRKSKSFSEYTDFFWEQDVKPDLILVDGRFRVCCFLTSLMYADEGTYILFDDYIDRTYYHFIEKFVSRAEECGQQCLFIVPPSKEIDFDDLKKDIDSFRYVMD